jgi:hypothetical protein
MDAPWLHARPPRRCPGQTSSSSARVPMSDRLPQSARRRTAMSTPRPATLTHSAGSPHFRPRPPASRGHSPGRHRHTVPSAVSACRHRPHPRTRPRRRAAALQNSATAATTAHSRKSGHALRHTGSIPTPFGRSPRQPPHPRGRCAACGRPGTGQAPGPVRRLSENHRAACNQSRQTHFGLISRDFEGVSLGPHAPNADATTVWGRWRDARSRTNRIPPPRRAVSQRREASPQHSPFSRDATAHALPTRWAGSRTCRSRPATARGDARAR